MQWASIKSRLFKPKPEKEFAQIEREWQGQVDPDSWQRFVAADEERPELSLLARGVRYTLILAILCLQYPLWFGKGSWGRVWEYQQSIEREKEKTRQVSIRNSGIGEEITNMRSGRFDAIEERARFDLLMVKPGEIFVATPEKTPATGNDH